MSLVIGHTILDDIPYINGKPAIWDESMNEELKEIWSQWKCPECGSRLSLEKKICLNACHLSAAAFQRFQSGLRDAVLKTRES